MSLLSLFLSNTEDQKVLNPPLRKFAATSTPTSKGNQTSRPQSTTSRSMWQEPHPHGKLSTSRPWRTISTPPAVPRLCACLVPRPKARRAAVWPRSCREVRWGCALISETQPRINFGGWAGTFSGEERIEWSVHGSWEWSLGRRGRRRAGAWRRLVQRSGCMFIYPSFVFGASETESMAIKCWTWRVGVGICFARGEVCLLGMHSVAKGCHNKTREAR